MNSFIIKDRSFYQKLLAIAIPMAVQNLINIAVNLLDTIMLGQLGEVAMSASSLGGQLGFMYMIINMGLTAGASVLTSQYWGRGDAHSVRKTMSMTYKISLALSVLFMILAMSASQFILSIYTNDAEVIVYGAQYLRVISLTYLLSGVTMTTLNMLRTVGTVKISLYVYGSSFFVNIFFNYALIFGKFGFPELGVVGAAAATVIARFVEMCIVLIYLLKYDEKVRFRPGDLKEKIDKEVLKIYIKYGLPVLCNEMLWSLGNSVLSVIMGHMGKEFVAANSICGVMMQCITFATHGINAAAAVMAGNTIGEGKYELAKKQALTLFVMSIGIGFLTCGLTLILKTPLVSFYNITAETQTIALEMLNAMALVNIFQAVASINMFGTLRGGGDSKFVAVTDVGSMWLLSVPLGWIAGLVLHRPAGIVYICLKATTIFECFAAAFRILSGKWVKDVTRSDEEIARNV
ncbi:MAG: MATE family efflux transporter [Oscillospiraceae bacterium]|nr:MATE family efflux transporter [Oscillospiraceae bacterium]